MSSKSQTYLLSLAVRLTIIALLGVTIAISAGLGALYKFQENWIEYRTTSETLKHDKYLYLTKCSPYHNEKAFQTLVKRVESLISKENSQWSRNAPIKQT